MLRQILCTCFLILPVVALAADPQAPVERSALPGNASQLGENSAFDIVIETTTGAIDITGWGGGRGRGRRWRHWYSATGLSGWARFDPVPAWGYGPYVEPVTREQEIESLKAQAGWLKEQLDAINRCLEQLEKEE